MKQLSLEDLDLSKAIEVIPSQDPATALRFNIPIPDWLDLKGAPRLPHEQIRQADDGSWRFNFYNDKDACWQRVRIDGSSVITFMAPTPEQAARLEQRLRDIAPDPEKLGPGQLAEVLAFAKNDLGLKDVYNNGRSGVKSYMHPWPPRAAGDTAHPALGAFLPNPQVSAAVYAPGAGAFVDGPTASPQRFENGAFISFPGQTKEKILSMPLAEMRGSKSFTVKLVQADVFVSSRTYTDGGSIETSKLSQQEAPRQKSATVPRPKAP